MNKEREFNDSQRHAKHRLNTTFDVFEFLLLLKTIKKGVLYEMVES
jgi:hypothetical protein